jgi:hypothetical protein
MPTLSVFDASGAQQTIQTLPGPGQATAANSSPVVLASDKTVVVGNTTVNVASSITRSANTTAYATGQLVANTTSAGSVTPLALTAARVSGGSGVIRKVRLLKASTSLSNASFRIHFFNSPPTVGAGDGSTLTLTGVNYYLGSADVTMDRAFTDGAWGAADLSFTDISFKLASGQTVYAFIEASAAYVPASAEVFTLFADILQD